MTPTSRRPPARAELVVRVELPERSSAADIDLDITEEAAWSSTTEGMRYKLDSARNRLLPNVLSEQGSAKASTSAPAHSFTHFIAAGGPVGLLPAPVWGAGKQGTDGGGGARLRSAQRRPRRRRRGRRGRRSGRRSAKPRRRRARPSSGWRRSASARGRRRLRRRSGKLRRGGAAAKAKAERELAAKQEAEKKAPKAPKVGGGCSPRSSRRRRRRLSRRRRRGSDRGSESEWVNVSEAEAEAAKAESPAKTTKQDFTDAVLSSKSAGAKPVKEEPQLAAPTPSVVDSTEAPAAPTGQQPRRGGGGGNLQPARAVSRPGRMASSSSWIDAAAALPP